MPVGKLTKPGPIPVEALDYFKRKKLRPSFNHEEVWAEEHDFAFTVAKVTERDLLNHVRGTVEKAIADGLTFETWKKAALPALEQSGWRAAVSEKATPSRLRLIYETNMRVARANGQEERAQETKDQLPYFIYELGPSTIHRQEHVRMAGTIRPVDDLLWKFWSPPCAYGCNCRRRQITKYEARKLGGESEVPKQTMVQWEFPDGRKEKVPAGVHPTFAYRKNAKARRESLEQAAAEDSGPTQLREHAGAVLFRLFKSFVANHLGVDGEAKRVLEDLSDGGRRVLLNLIARCGDDGDRIGITKLDGDTKTVRKYIDGELLSKGLVEARHERFGTKPTSLGRSVGNLLR